MYKAVDYMTVYGDVLVILNLYINYFLLRGTALILRKPLSAKRCLASAAIGAAASLVILLPSLPFAVIALIKAGTAAAMVPAAFGNQDWRSFATSVLCLFVTSFLFAGIMLGLWLFLAPLGMTFDNGVAYFDIPITVVAVLTAVGYLVVRALKRVSDNRLSHSRVCEVVISSGGVMCVLRGLADTGNGLRDAFSGRGVVVCCQKSIENIIPDNVRSYLSGSAPESGGIRLIPCTTVANNTLIPVFKADSVSVAGKAADVLVGVSRCPLGEEFDCVFNPRVISL